MSDPYRTADRSEVRQHVLASIDHAREMLQAYRECITKCTARSWSTDLVALGELNKTLRVVCEHERELLKQLAELG